ncbi:hypothetical protein C2857_001690 [Epichloe festucae Fl1]|uniref:Uncharacterized protein n=1 Tax=Epichloe festucae (strain Fl1) TaxID=877507 RepID=A0A7S9KRX9_EPIFF|nr:hypothetical protein C2857_001690 [Epichloe festucae Fl1]
MKFGVLLLASLPATLAASLAYTPPAALAAEAKEHPQTCILPHSYHIKNFHPHCSKNGTMTAYKFLYVNDATNRTTSCSYRKRKHPEGSGKRGGAPRFSCKNKAVSFIWDHDHSKMTMIQKVCPTKGVFQYEVSGSVIIPVSCASGECHNKTSDYMGIFSSITCIGNASVARAADVVRKQQNRGIAWSFDGYN